MSKVTKWYPPEITPVRVGHYQCKYLMKDNQHIPDFFDGKDWHYCGPNGIPNGIRTRPLPWRGLKKEPK